LHNIKQQKKHEYIDKKYKQIQLQKNIERTKKLKHR
jgi:RNA-splicing ligase RtcB